MTDALTVFRNSINSEGSSSFVRCSNLRKSLDELNDCTAINDVDPKLKVSPLERLLQYQDCPCYDKDAIRVLLEYGVDVQTVPWQSVMHCLEDGKYNFRHLYWLLHEVGGYFPLHPEVFNHRMDYVYSIADSAMAFLNYYGSCVGFPFLWKENQRLMGKGEHNNLRLHMLLEHDLLSETGRRGLFLFFVESSPSSSKLTTDRYRTVEQCLLSMLTLGYEYTHHTKATVQLNQSQYHKQQKHQQQPALIGLTSPTLVDPALIIRTIHNTYKTRNHVQVMKYLLMELQHHCTHHCKSEEARLYGEQLFKQTVNYTLAQAIKHLPTVKMLLSVFNADPNALVPVINNFNIHYLQLNYAYHAFIENHDTQLPIGPMEDVDVNAIEMNDVVNVANAIPVPGDVIEKYYFTTNHPYGIHFMSTLHVAANLNTGRAAAYHFTVYLMNDATTRVDPFKPAAISIQQDSLETWQTPIHLAMENYHTTIVEYYLENSLLNHANELVLLDPVRDETGHIVRYVKITPLMLLVQRNGDSYQKQALQWIQDGRADVFVRDSDGDTVVERLSNATRFQKAEDLLKASLHHRNTHSAQEERINEEITDEINEPNIQMETMMNRKRKFEYDG